MRLIVFNEIVSICYYAYKYKSMLHIYEITEFPTTSFVDVKTIAVKEKFVKNEAPTVNCTPLSTCHFREESEEESSVFVENG